MKHRTRRCPAASVEHDMLLATPTAAVGTVISSLPGSPRGRDWAVRTAACSPSAAQHGCETSQCRLPARRPRCSLRHVVHLYVGVAGLTLLLVLRPRQVAVTRLVLVERPQRLHFRGRHCHLLSLLDVRIALFRLISGHLPGGASLSRTGADGLLPGDERLSEVAVS